jgi:hypothetical protein
MLIIYYLKHSALPQNIAVERCIGELIRDNEE